MSEEKERVLPAGWTWVEMGDIVREYQPGFACGSRDAQGYVQLRMNNIGVESRVALESVLRVPKRLTNLEKYELKNGDVLFNNTNSPELVGKTVLYRGEIDQCVFSNHISRLRVDESLVVPAWLTWTLVTEQRRGTFQKMCHRFVGQAGISRKDLLRLPVSIPPLKEQRRIVAKMEELFEELRTASDALQKAPSTTKQFRQSILARALLGELTERVDGDANQSSMNTELETRDQVSRRRRPMDEAARRPKLPTGWSWVHFRDICNAQNGRSFPSRFYTDNGIRLLRPGNLHSSGKLIWTSQNTRFLPTSFADKYPNFIIGPGEIVMNLTAQSLKDEFLGRVCITEEDTHCLLNQRLARIRPHLDLNPKYLFWILKSPHFRDFVHGLESGTLIQHMFTSQLGNFVLPVAPPKEQQLVVARIEEMMLTIENVDINLNDGQRRLKEVEQSILAKAFKGELVLQDPQDEPVSQLLQRMKHI
jgi:restriction endonuclease S subunit